MPPGMSRPSIKTWSAPIPGQSPSTVTRLLQPRCTSRPGPRSGLDTSVSLPGRPEACRYSCHIYCECFQHSLLPRKGVLSCSRDEETAGSGPERVGRPRTLPGGSASRTRGWGGGRCPRPPGPSVKPHRAAERAGRTRCPRCAPQVSSRPPPPLRAAPRPLRLCLGGRPAGRGVTWSLPPPPASPEPALLLVPAPPLPPLAPRLPGPLSPQARRAEFSRAGNCHVKHSRPRAPGAGLRPSPRSRGARARTPAARGARGGAFGGRGLQGRGPRAKPGRLIGRSSCPFLFALLGWFVCFPPTGQRF